MGLFARFRPKAKRAELESRLGELSAQPRSGERDRELLGLRHRLGIEAVRSPDAAAEFPDPAPKPPARGEESGCPEIRPEELTPEVLRAAILDAGCLLIRGLVPEAEARDLASGIERAFETRVALRDGDREDADAFYEELEPEAPYEVRDRGWAEEAGGVFAGDSPRLLQQMMETFERVGLPGVIEGYLGEAPLITADKTTLRKATPDVGGAWHQDGKFMGEVRALNVWLALSRCGDEAPGMDLVPQRLDGFVPTGTEGAWLEDQVADAVAVEAAGERGIVRPVFQPGDVLLFDEFFLHSTATDPEMTKPRYAIESWFFGPSAFPSIYVPLAV